MMEMVEEEEGVVSNGGHGLWLYLTKGEGVWKSLKHCLWEETKATAYLSNGWDGIIIDTLACWPVYYLYSSFYRTTPVVLLLATNVRISQFLITSISW